MSRSTALWLPMVMGAVPLFAADPRLAIQILPQGSVTIEARASDPASGSLLGRTLAASLGCALVDVRESEAFQATCDGIFQRQGQILEGSLDFGALRGLSASSLDVDVAFACGPYLRDSFPRSWKTTCHAGVIHRSFHGSPERLPQVPVHLALGYRQSDLAFIFLPFPLAILLSAAVIVWLSLCASRARPQDGRVLWFPFIRSVAWALTGVAIAWAAYWGTLASLFNADIDALALLSEWNSAGKNAILAGKVAAVVLEIAPLLIAGTVLALQPPAILRPVRAPGWRIGNSLRITILPALTVIVPAWWALDAFNASLSGSVIHIFTAGWLAFISSLVLRWLMRVGRGPHAAPLNSGEVLERLRAAALKAGVTLQEVQVLPAGRGLMADPFEVEQNRVVLSDYLVEKLEPAEIEAAVTRQWCVPMRRYPDVPRVLSMFVCLWAGLIIGLLLQALVNMPLLLFRLPTIPTRLGLPVTLASAVLAGCWLSTRIERRAAERAVRLSGDAGAMKSAIGKLAILRAAPWEWKHIARSAPATVPTAPSAGEVAAPPVFSSNFRSTMANLKALALVATVSGPPLVLALGVRFGWIPSAVRWPAYLAGLLAALTLRHAASDYLDYWSYRRLRERFLARSPRPADTAARVFVGISPEARPLSYDGFYDWDLGFLTISADRLAFQGEKTGFALDRERVSEVRLAPGAPQVSDAGWIFVGWRDSETGTAGTFTIILPRADSPWKLSQRVRELHRTLQRWREGTSSADGSTEPLTRPQFQGVKGKPIPSPIPSMILTVAANGIGWSYIGGFRFWSEATAYFVLVWACNALVDYFGPVLLARRHHEMMPLRTA